MKLIDRTHLAPTLSAVVMSSLFETGGSELKAHALVEEALNDPAQRAKILEEEFRYALRAYKSHGTHPRAA